jgi:chromatin remodeling complex protein RSC6
MATKPAKKASVKSAKPQNAFQKPLQPSAELAAIVGSDPVSRGEVTSKVWDYIKSHNLQNPENRRNVSTTLIQPGSEFKLGSLELRLVD